MNKELKESEWCMEKQRVSAKRKHRKALNRNSEPDNYNRQNKFTREVLQKI